MMNRLVEARPLGEWRIELTFSDGLSGPWDASGLLSRSGTLLEPLREPAYFGRFFIDAGALCWPNGLELSPDRLHAQVAAQAADLAQA
jgi:hypothetical protein